MVAANQSPAKPSRRDYLLQYPGFGKPYLSVAFDVNRQLTTYLNIDNLTNSTRFERHNGNLPAGPLWTRSEALTVVRLEP